MITYFVFTDNNAPFFHLPFFIIIRYITYLSLLFFIPTSHSKKTGKTDLSADKQSHRFRCAEH